ncbi:NADH-ubiquinone reductase complex 1 MLRQ subunit [Mycotypha africana]|uniref:NADH-ubiquinone reductase complex 1 MLRQ subunit n=1 Tax=Mycotypha africana TaxID=64632 RepID=UPI002301938C|nr:NADH-ubiquinone reductase complex 1 MLRQ subunit [Mycotypha africana]KAI8975165.1 NADH-ubiquinone reductase complex 1 MLRQ subunit [Mycotypha africana]
MRFAQFIRKNPDLAPLFVITAAGCTAAVSYPLYLLRTHSDIRVDKNNKYPWQKIEQHQNTKFMTVNPEFFESRRNKQPPFF